MYKTIDLLQKEISTLIQKGYTQEVQLLERILKLLKLEAEEQEKTRFPMKVHLPQEAILDILKVHVENLTHQTVETYKLIREHEVCFECTLREGSISPSRGSKEREADLLPEKIERSELSPSKIGQEMKPLTVNSPSNALTELNSAQKSVYAAIESLAENAYGTTIVASLEALTGTKVHYPLVVLRIQELIDKGLVVALRKPNDGHQFYRIAGSPEADFT